MSRVWWGIPLMRFLLPDVFLCSNNLREIIICIPPSNWSYWWRWKIFLSLWWLMFLCTWYILRPRVCVSFSWFLFSGEPGCSYWGQWAVKFLRWRILEARRRCVQFLRGFFFVPIFILRPNWAKWLERRVINFSMSVLDSKANSPSYTWCILPTKFGW